MCGRFNQTASGEESRRGVRPRRGARARPALQHRAHPARRRDRRSSRRPGGAARAAHLGPGAADALGKERGFINARSETAWPRSPPSARPSPHRRCLIPATGFYEWQKLDARRRQPWLIRLAAAGPFAFAGLWEPAAGAVPGRADLHDPHDRSPTSSPRPVHDRMPVILAPASYARWLDPAVEVARRAAPAAAALPRRGDDRVPGQHARQQPGLRRPGVPGARLR